MIFAAFCVSLDTISISLPGCSCLILVGLPSATILASHHECEFLTVLCFFEEVRCHKNCSSVSSELTNIAPELTTRKRVDA